MKIVTRPQWQARPPNRSGTVAVRPYQRLQVHHSATGFGGLATVQAIQLDHLRRGWVDVAYHFLVGGDGQVFEGRPIHWQHGNSAPRTDASVCAIGNFDVDQPRPTQIDAVVELARHGARMGWWSPTLIGHRDVPESSPTRCPGAYLHRLIPAMQTRVDGVPEPTEDDMWIARSTDDQGRQRNALVSGVFRTEFVSNSAMAEATRLGAPVRDVSWEFFSRQLVNARGS